MDLNAAATASGFARLVGISQPAVSGHVRDGNLPRGGSFAEWLHAYCDHLRKYAAGRGGERQKDLNEAKTEEALAKAAMTRLSYNERLGNVVAAEDVARVLTEWAAYANREYRGATARLKQSIESEHGVTLADETLSNVIEPAIERIGRFAENAAGDFDRGGEQIPAA